MSEFKELEGQLFHTVTVGDDEICFEGDKNNYKLFHEQDCCEHVYIESITGDIATLLPNNKIIEAYESYKVGDDDDDEESSTWSFYTIRTMRDTFTIRFFGSSNGYYSETADFTCY